MFTRLSAPLISILILVSASASAFAADRGDGRIAFYNYHTGEVLEVTYRKGRKYNKDALRKIEHVFRSRSDDKETAIDPALIELLDNVQDHFGADCLELISGYRSPELNRQLKNEGINVAENSMHIEGKAADIHIDEVTEEAVAEYARSLQIGGVGYYPAWDFVHVDTGEARNWDLPDKPGRLLTAMRKGVKWQVTTDRDVYLPNEPVDFEIMNITRTAKKFDAPLQIQIFRRGEWKTVQGLNDCAGKKLASGTTCSGRLPTTEVYGKYRFVIPGPEGYKHLETLSNEFYRKKL